MENRAKMFVLYLLNDDMINILHHFYIDNEINKKMTFNYFENNLHIFFHLVNNTDIGQKTFPQFINYDMNVFLSRIIDYYCHKYNIIFLEDTIQNKIIKIYINE